ncbi:MAG: thiamine phosphate synthase [Deltaproteobacteria bacterium]|nr:thiamine phosphate synthase [Deltaproteobacteria bacterium]
MKQKVSLIRGFYPIVDTAYLKPCELALFASSLLKGGAKIIQLRAKGLGGRELLFAANEIKRLAASYGAVFIVNDRVDIALLSGADGVHLGQDDMAPLEARKALGPNAIIGLSTHNAGEAKDARSLGADYISFGPVFATSTKKDAETPKGLIALKEARSATSLPIVAIGGITEENMGEVLGSGATAVAMISEVLLSKAPENKAFSIVSRINPSD